MSVEEFILKNRKTILVTIVTNLGMFVVLGLVAAAFISTNRASIGSFLLRDTVGVDVRPGEPIVATNIVNEDNRIVEIVEKANPAVVSVVITKDVPVLEEYYREGSPFDFFNDSDPFDFFFNVPQMERREKGTEKREVGGGSGFLVSSDGLVMTNRHVVLDESASYTVFTSDGKKYEAQVAAKDPFLDIALLRIKGGKSFPYLTFGDSGKLKPGQTVIAIGNPLGEFRNSVSVGVISGLARSIIAGDGMGNSEQLEEVLQTDAAINPGNSGGPLLNVNGQVIGVNVAVAQGSENIGFALPSNLVKGTVTSVKETGEIIRPYIGVRYVQIDNVMKEKNNLSVDYGALVLRGETREDLAVIPGSPADKAGIVENDIILEVDGVELKDGHSLASLIRTKNVGDSIKLKILHRGQEKLITVVLERVPKGL
ncbi:MAG: Uncharacterized protein G01um101448_171 [Parcubacteria group bacterium Gr01-1014_48]|nr:MAG: Uncharacterized protein Greene041614_719 [Parcubacteria group bacterium Greene0416_14]TSC74356.1 MAG: Uncharacterized protein G01um101448_171 [Parcubacteria group bacterium Gr01-1014_48]TSD00727.1 MAG: Uncharacterized protein Greene101415_727 [Parcubacteria group bacterium Greene1014_15]TSD07849.1 MAG: Uncharacterized protein Greene07144_653 [Parcubacteria group bacterium Greene0714_4]